MGDKSPPAPIQPPSTNQETAVLSGRSAPGAGGVLTSQKIRQLDIFSIATDGPGAYAKYMYEDMIKDTDPNGRITTAFLIVEASEKLYEHIIDMSMSELIKLKENLGSNDSRLWTMINPNVPELVAKEATKVVVDALIEINISRHPPSPNKRDRGGVRRIDPAETSAHLPLRGFALWADKNCPGWKREMQPGIP
jgi:hypothetical protein